MVFHPFSAWFDSIGGSFINDAERIANRDYQPTDDDVIRARLRTIGVQEYRFVFDHGQRTAYRQPGVLSNSFPR